MGTSTTVVLDHLQHPDIISCREFFADPKSHSGIRPTQTSWPEFSTDLSKRIGMNNIGRVEVLTPVPRGRVSASNYETVVMETLDELGFHNWHANHIGVPVRGDSPRRASTRFALHLAQLAFFKEQFSIPRIICLFPYTEEAPEGTRYVVATLKDRANLLIIAQLTPGSYTLSYLHSHIEQIAQWDSFTGRPIVEILPQLLKGLKKGNGSLPSPSAIGDLAWKELPRIEWPVTIHHSVTERRTTFGGQRAINRSETREVFITFSHFTEGNEAILCNSTVQMLERELGFSLSETEDRKQWRLEFTLVRKEFKGTPPEKDPRLAVLNKHLGDKQLATRRWKYEQLRKDPSNFSQLGSNSSGRGSNLWVIAPGASTFHISANKQIAMVKVIPPKSEVFHRDGVPFGMILRATKTEITPIT